VGCVARPVCAWSDELLVPRSWYQEELLVPRSWYQEKRVTFAYVRRETYGEREGSIPFMLLKSPSCLSCQYSVCCAAVPCPHATVRVHVCCAERPRV